MVSFKIIYAGLHKNGVTWVKIAIQTDVQTSKFSLKVSSVEKITTNTNELFQHSISSYPKCAESYKFC